MTKDIVLLGSLAAIALMCSSPLSYAGGLDDNKVLRDSNGHIVRSFAYGTCVRSKWEGGVNPCAPAPKIAAVAPAPKPVPQTYTQTTLSTADRTVYFAFDSATIMPEAKDKLDSMAVTLKNASDVKGAKIVGYADRKGTASYNQKLSKERAEAVKNYLAQQGYVNTQLADVRSAGESAPIADCSNAMQRDHEIECLSPDRRVEVEVQYSNTQHYSQAY